MNQECDMCDMNMLIIYSISTPTDKEKSSANADSTPENHRRSSQSPKKPSKELKLDIKSSEINGEPVDPAVSLEHQK